MILRKRPERDNRQVFFDGTKNTAFITLKKSSEGRLGFGSHPDKFELGMNHSQGRYNSLLFVISSSANLYEY